MDKILNVCLIGCGRAGMIHARNYKNKIENARIVACVDAVEAAAKAAAEELGVTKVFTDYHDILNDPDIHAVIVVSPTDLHRDIVVTCEAGNLCLDFVSMSLDFEDQFGELVDQIDQLIQDECMIFELYSHGECVLGGCRGTDEIDIDHSLPAFVRSLRDGNAELYADLKEIVQRGRCFCRLRGWCKERNRSLILS